MKSLLLLLAVTGPALAAPLRPISECLQLEPNCPELAFADSLGFVSGDGVGRICGSPGDRVVARRRSPIDIPCRIAEVTPLTKEQYGERMHGLDKPKGVVEIREEAKPQE